jgi:hypothetical protein
MTGSTGLSSTGEFLEVTRMLDRCKLGRVIKIVKMVRQVRYVR